MFYEQLLEILTEQLNSADVNFLMSYNNNGDVNWKDIVKENLPYQCYGVLRQDSGDVEYTGEQNINVLNMHVAFCVPSEARDRLYQALALINNLQQLNQTTYTISDTASSLNNKIAMILCGYRSDGQFQRINGLDMCLTDFYFQVKTYDSILTSHDCSLAFSYTTLVNNVATNFTNKHLINVANVIFDHTKTFNSNVRGTSSSLSSNMVESRAKQLIITIIPSANDEVLKELEEHEDEDKNYTIAYNNGIKTRTLVMQLVRINENVPTGGSYGMEITFIATNN